MNYVRSGNRQKELVKSVTRFEKGQTIITAGGIYGTVKEVKDVYVLVEVDNNVTIRVDKNMVMRDPAVPRLSRANKRVFRIKYKKAGDSLLFL